MTPDLDRLLASPEGQYFDRKSLWDGPDRRHKRDRKVVRDEIAEYVAAFANADGGVLILGVEDDGTVSGHGYADDAVEQFLLVPTQRVTPPQPAGKRYSYGRFELLVFDVPCAPAAVRVVNDGTPRRVGDTNVRGESESNINAIKQRGRVESPETDEAPGNTIEQLDPRRLADARAAAGFADRPDADYLVARRLADWRGPSLVLRKGALLLFAREPHFIEHPNAGIRIFRVDGTELGTGARYNVQELPRIEGCLPEVIERARATLSGLIRRSSRLHDLFFREMPEYPTYAWQEALVNAVAHRDYRVRGRGVEVHLFDDRMEVSSPGGLVAEVSLDGLRRRERVHAARNPLLTRVLAELGLMREQGEGIPRIFEEVERSWLKLPELRAEEHAFKLVLFNEPIFAAPDPEWLRVVSSLPIQDRQRRVLLAHPHGEFSNADYQKLNAVDRDTAYRELKELVALGLVDGPGAQGRGAAWRVTPPSGSAPTVGKAALVDAMRRHGELRAEDYRMAMGVARQTASVQLRTLTSDDVLRLDGKGRGARYLPGPAWDAWAAAAQSEPTE